MGTSTNCARRSCSRATWSTKRIDGSWAGVDLTELGFQSGDLDGKYFSDAAYLVAFTAYDDYLVTVTASDSTATEKPTTPSVVTIDEDGTWTETP